MKKYLVDQLRKFSFVKGKEKTWISKLSDDQLYILFSKLRNGENSRSIARYVQNTWKISQESSTHSISQGIIKFQRRIAHLLLTNPPEPEETFLSGCSSDPEDDDALTTMENIARQYESRIKGMIAEERKTGIRYPYINRDLQALANLRKAILKQKAWDSTHSDPLKGKEYQKIKERIERRFNNWMDDLGDDGQARMIRIADRFLELVEKHAVIEDDTHTLVKNQT